MKRTSTSVRLPPGSTSGTLRGFTPVIDVVVDDLGFMAALVFGRMWRYCQMSNRVCTASQSTIAEGLGIARSTVNKHIRSLCNAGYLEDTTPDLKNRPHVYQDTGKIHLRQVIEAVPGVAQTDTTVAESDAKKESKKESRNQVKKEKQERDNDTNAGRIPTPDSTSDAELPGTAKPPKTVDLGTGDPQADRVAAEADTSKVNARDLLAAEIFRLMTPNLTYPTGKTKRAKEARRPFELSADKVLERIGRENYKMGLDACYLLLTEPTDDEDKWLVKVSSPHGLIGMIAKRVDQMHDDKRMREQAMERNRASERRMSEREAELKASADTKPMPETPIVSEAVSPEWTRIWSNVRGDLRLQLALPTWEAHIEKAMLLKVNGNDPPVMVIVHPDKNSLRWAQARLVPVIQQTAERIAGQPVEITFLEAEGLTK